MLLPAVTETGKMSDTVASLNDLPRTGNKLDREKLDTLVAHCIDGDSRAFAELFRVYKDVVHKMVYRILGPVVTVDEIIQDVFVEIYKSLKSFAWKAQFSTWVYRITINVCMQYLRTKHAKTNRFGSLAEPDPSELPGTTFPDGEAYTDRKKTLARIYEALDKLHPKKRLVVVLHDMNGNTMEEIAEITKVPVGTVKSRLFHGRDKLKRLLKDIVE
jgi:RNA polymerase sigma-70 factor (ECF subfamily)